MDKSTTDNSISEGKYIKVTINLVEEKTKAEIAKLNKRLDALRSR